MIATRYHSIARKYSEAAKLKEIAQSRAQYKYKQLPARKVMITSSRAIM
jgi:hypothetical protein